MSDSGMAIDRAALRHTKRFHFVYRESLVRRCRGKPEDRIAVQRDRRFARVVMEFRIGDDQRTRHDPAGRK